MAVLSLLRTVLWVVLFPQQNYFLSGVVWKLLVVVVGQFMIQIFLGVVRVIVVIVMVFVLAF